VIVASFSCCNKTKKRRFFCCVTTKKRRKKVRELTLKLESSRVRVPRCLSLGSRSKWLPALAMAIRFVFAPNSTQALALVMAIYSTLNGSQALVMGGRRGEVGEKNFGAK